jgi:mRNA interferase MazF
VARATAHGEIWWANVDKRRPVAIASRDDTGAARQRTTVAAITTTIRGIPSEIRVNEREGLEGPSAINCDELITIDKARLVRRVGRLSESRMREFHHALAFALGMRVDGTSV